ncbi:dTDP-glucose 4,6-dehydratase [Aureococcus anophagefferens]|uniref:dTDP-glucose 4,6-dehydratase n=1 Tax=Aureococcus anophagefferens TaxID=44056 RepID=A0ABR1G447_AURAN
MDNVLPEFKRIDASGSKQLSHLHWDTTRALKEPSGDYYKPDGSELVAEPKPPKPAPVPPQTKTISTALAPTKERPICDRERGDARRDRIERPAAEEKQAKAIAAPRETSLRVYNDVEDDGELYLSRDDNTRRIRIVPLPRGASRTARLETGPSRTRRPEPVRGDVTVALSTMARLQRVDDDEASHASHTTATSAGGATLREAPSARAPRQRVAPAAFRADEPLGMELEFDSGDGLRALEDGMVLASLNGAPCRNLDEFESLFLPRAAGGPIVIEFEARRGDRAGAPAPAPPEEDATFLTGGDDGRRAGAWPAPPSPDVAWPAVTRDLLRILEPPSGEQRKACRVQVHNGSARTLELRCSDGARGGLRRRATIPPFGAIVEAATTMEHWLLVFAGPGEAPPAPDAPALGVRVGGGAVQSTHGYSLIWQSADRVLSFVPRAGVARHFPTKLRPEARSADTRARQAALDEVHAARAAVAEGSNCAITVM